MNLFVAICTIATLCFIQASVLEDYDSEDLEMEMGRDLEEYDVEDQDLEMDMELTSDLEEYDAELRQDLDKWCDEGWGGQCYFRDNLDDHSCDFIKNGGDAPPPNSGYNQICADGERKSCCVDCYAQKQIENCGNIRYLNNPPRRVCCTGDWVLKNMDSGCNCCGKCKPNRRCGRKGGFCVTENGPGLCTFTYCVLNGGRLYSRDCRGGDCKCCIGATPRPTTGPCA